MRFTEFDPETVAEDPGPTLAALVLQCEADYDAERKRGNDPDVLRALTARRAAVRAAKSDEDARRIYDKMVADYNALPEPKHTALPEPEPEG